MKNHNTCLDMIEVRKESTIEKNMTEHTSGTFLHSCLRVPIDPCNNCPAPIYNRPKMYLGNLAAITPLSGTTKLATAPTLRATEFYDMETLLASNGIRSLSKLYDSIPDYTEINHLSSEEFYSTLDTLRSTYCELRTKPSGTYASDGKINSSPLSSRCSISETKNKSKRPLFGKKTHKKKSTQKIWKHGINSNSIEEHCVTETPCSFTQKMELVTRTRPQSCFQEYFFNEVRSLKQKLLDYEDELKRRSASVSLPQNKTKTIDTQNESCEKLQETPQQPLTEKQIYKRSALHTRTNMKKSYSFNDITNIAESKENVEFCVKSNFKKLIEHSLIKSDKSKFSSYFEPKKERSLKCYSREDVLPRVKLESPSTINQSLKSSSRTSGVFRKKKAKYKKIQDQYKVPFTFFNLSAQIENYKHKLPTPVHPVSRPNLAATLRVENSKRKLKERQSSCPHQEIIPQFDWEVRKTPAWKSLSLNEPHREIIKMRVATRKAEQALQQREYELHMELMRQRVKSAPLLMESVSYWSSNAGKLTHTHNCQCEDTKTKHLCQSIQRKIRSKSAGCRRRPDVHEQTTSECSQRSSKMNSVRKIYSNAKANSRNSKSAGRKTSCSKQSAACDTQKSLQPPAIDSGDELCSLDRALL